MSTKKTLSAILTEKAVSLLEKLKGKKLSIVGVCTGVFILAAIGVHYGYIPEEFLNPDLIVKYVSGVFEQPVVNLKCQLAHWSYQCRLALLVQ